MSKTIAILGRQPELAIAELEALFGADIINPFGINGCFINKDVDEKTFARLGGSMRVCKVVGEVQSTKWRDIEHYITQEFAQNLQITDAKLHFGISTFELRVSAKDLARTALSLKKSLKSRGQSVRMVPQKSVELNSATVLYNKLTSRNGLEVVVISDGSNTIIARTTQIQDIDAYAERDHGRPKRDAKVGMLPPKLAQIIVNLVVRDSNPSADTVLLDPFCGTGVLLQEALLMGFGVYGTDIEPRMIEYSKANLDWLASTFDLRLLAFDIKVGDATEHTWEPQPQFVACETYLGQPYSTLPPSDQLDKNIYFVNQLHTKFLKNIGEQLKSGTRLCLAVPAWRTGNTFKHLKALDSLEKLGYNRVRFTHVDERNLIYHRQGQVVARQLVVLEKN